MTEDTATSARTLLTTRRFDWVVAPAAPVIDPITSAELAGLRYVMEDEPGIRRVRRGRGFAYIGPDGQGIRDEETRDRIRSLAIPPAWTEVWICATVDGHIQATGRDGKGRKQYRYHPAWGEQRSLTKYGRALLFAQALPVIRARVEQDLAHRGLSREKVLATVVRLLEKTFIRIGNKEYARTNESFGLTTLRDQHVDVSGSTLRFRFRGKSGQDHDIVVRDRRLARIVQRARDLPGYELFQYIDDDGHLMSIDSGDVNAYLREITGQDFSAKDFRTWGGTLLAARELKAIGPATSERQAKKNVVQAIRRVANLLGNRPATCRKYYVHPAVLDAYMNGSLIPTLERLSVQPVADAPHELDVEEAALLELLAEDGRRKTEDGG